MSAPNTSGSEQEPSCWGEHYPRCPYTCSQRACYNCEAGCDKPGLGSKDHDPSQNSCGDCDLCCLPIYIVIDTIFFIPRVFGFCSVDNPN